MKSFWTVRCGELFLHKAKDGSYVWGKQEEADQFDSKDPGMRAVLEGLTAEKKRFVVYATRK